MSSNLAKVILVTGANKGIGKEIVKQLALQHQKQSENKEVEVFIYLTARSSDLGNEALEDLKQKIDSSYKANLAFHQLDINSTESIKALKEFIASKHQGLDVLINNAGIFNEHESVTEENAKFTLKTIYYSTVEMVETFLPILRENGRIINVSSALGDLKSLSPSLQDKFLDPKLDLPSIKSLLDEYVKAVKENKFTEQGWPKLAYSQSKIALNAATLYFHRQAKQDPRNLLIRSCCPGYVATDLNNNKGTKTVQQGSETPVYLALGDKDKIANATTEEEINKGFGFFWTENKPAQWLTLP